jgi:hypothetical protein
MWETMAAMAALQLINQQQQAKQAKQQNKIAAAQTEFSPWTGQGAGQTVQAPSAMGAAAGGAVQGMALSQAYDKYKMDKELHAKRMAEPTTGSPDWGAMQSRNNMTYNYNPSMGRGQGLA